MYGLWLQGKPFSVPPEWVTLRHPWKAGDEQILLERVRAEC